MEARDGVIPQLGCRLGGQLGQVEGPGTDEILPRFALTTR